MQETNHRPTDRRKRREDLSTKKCIVGERYVLNQKVGAGSFGDIYIASDLRTRELVAIKVEPANVRKPRLEFEMRLYRLFRGGSGFPRVHWFGRNESYSMMAMDLLGNSLEECFNQCGRRFSLKTVLQLADQLITRLEFIHSRHYIHRDVKPHNFLLGPPGLEHQIFVIDFGLSKRYWDSENNEHLPYSSHRGMTGTVRYSSINTHHGIEQSRRDDLEALGYVLIYFLQSSLPWQGVRGIGRKEKYKKIRDIKVKTPMATLCAHLPDEFSRYIKYCRELEYEEAPDYEYLRALFRAVARRMGIQYDGVFDWTRVPGTSPESIESTSTTTISGTSRQGAQGAHGHAAHARRSYELPREMARKSRTSHGRRHRDPRSPDLQTHMYTQPHTPAPAPAAHYPPPPPAYPPPAAAYPPPPPPLPPPAHCPMAPPPPPHAPGAFAYHPPPPPHYPPSHGHPHARTHMAAHAHAHAHLNHSVQYLNRSVQYPSSSVAAQDMEGSTPAPSPSLHSSQSRSALPSPQGSPNLRSFAGWSAPLLPAVPRARGYTAPSSAAQHADDPSPVLPHTHKRRASAEFSDTPQLAECPTPACGDPISDEENACCPRRRHRNRADNGPPPTAASARTPVHVVRTAPRSPLQAMDAQPQQARDRSDGQPGHVEPFHSDEESLPLEIFPTVFSAAPLVSHTRPRHQGGEWTARVLVDNQSFAAKGATLDIADTKATADMLQCALSRIKLHAMPWPNQPPQAWNPKDRPPPHIMRSLLEPWVALYRQAASANMGLQLTGWESDGVHHARVRVSTRVLGAGSAPSRLYAQHHAVCSAAQSFDPSLRFEMPPPPAPHASPSPPRSSGPPRGSGTLSATPAQPQPYETRYGYATSPIGLKPSSSTPSLRRPLGTLGPSPSPSPSPGAHARTSFSPLPHATIASAGGSGRRRSGASVPSAPPQGRRGALNHMSHL